MSGSSCERALGNMAMLFDIIPTIHRPKLERVEAGTPAFDYMLATLVFDLAKKNAMLHKALREYSLHADPALTRQYLDDVRALEPLGQDYEALAHATERQMLRSVAECVADHRALGEMLERWNSEDSSTPE
ncbi:MAG: hypothetical protein Q8N53_07110 [Longimicrobiales bacterium]|nr:hypothetical protein [Longimicrobiales bacterium]